LCFVFYNISPSKSSIIDVKKLESRYTNLIENISDFLWIAEKINSKLKVTYYSPAVLQLTGYSEKEFLSDPRLWLKIIHSDDVAKVKKKIMLLLKNPLSAAGKIEYRIINKMNKVIWLRNKLSLIRDEEGKIESIYGFVSDITAHKNMEEEYKIYSDNLQKLNEAKDKFISIISHDLRIPFNSILGFTDILLGRKNITEEERTRFVKFIQDSALNMLGLVNKLLDWARLQTGKIKFDTAQLNLHTVAESSVTIVSGSALKKNIEIINNIDKNLFVQADNHYLLQVFNNLLSNAVKFTSPERKITLSAEMLKDKRTLQIGIRDTSVGIRKENLCKLFNIDSKFSLLGTSGEKGSGMGLLLCRDIITKHGGKIWAESEIGSGSVFYFTLPAFITNILLVDDTKADRVLYSRMLKRIIPEYNIEEANNANDALKIIQSKKPALIITDHLMPLMNGYDLVRKLKAANLKSAPKIIILSNYINENLIDEYERIIGRNSHLVEQDRR